jgi:D-alanyl-lipoteichoic acid acyltransferase DltB (MBOAT superfamily)
MLGGNRKGEVLTCANLMITMLLGGLWHGASWLFVVWGGLHGMYLIAEKFVKKTEVAEWKFWQSTVGQFFLSLVTFIFI